MKKGKNSYSLDSNNRLLIRRAGSKKAIPLNGVFRVTRDNRLTFWLNEPISWRKDNNLPKKITFTGTWRLDDNCDLEFVLDKSRYQNAGEKLGLKGKLIAAEADSIVFAVSTYKESVSRVSRVQTIRLTGLWQADRHNRLSFVVTRKLLSDTLVFEGGWQVNRNQQITYIYEKTDLKTKTRISEEVVFRGYWQIVTNKKLVYILSRDSGSCFAFRVQLETPNLYPQEGKIKFRLGVGLKKNKPPVPKTICLYGEWKFFRKSGLVFTMEYAAGIIHNLEFGFTVIVSKTNSITVSLLNKENEPTGISVTMTHRFLRAKNAEGFIRVKPGGRSRGIDAGLTFPF